MWSTQKADVGRGGRGSLLAGSQTAMIGGVGWLAAGPKEAQPKQAEALPKQAEAKAEQAQAQAQATSCASSVEIRTSFQVFFCFKFLGSSPGFDLYLDGSPPRMRDPGFEWPSNVGPQELRRGCANTQVGAAQAGQRPDAGLSVRHSPRAVRPPLPSSNPQPSSLSSKDCCSVTMQRVTL